MHSQKYNLAISGHDTKPVSFFDGAEIGSGLLEGGLYFIVSVVETGGSSFSHPQLFLGRG